MRSLMLIIGIAATLVLEIGGSNVFATFSRQLKVNPIAQGATVESTAGSGPTGSEEWLNSGLNTTGGWNLPFIQLRDVVLVEDASFYAAIGAWCRPYDSSFREASITYSIPTLFIASIALSKSGCNPNAVGSNGQRGLMQLSRSQLPPGGSVSPHDNIMIGAKLLQDRLFVFNNNIIECIGMYGGWFRGMTEWDPCVKQRQVPQDLDFLQKFFNGLILGRNYEWMGTYQCEGLCSGARLC